MLNGWGMYEDGCVFTRQRVLVAPDGTEVRIAECVFEDAESVIAVLCNIVREYETRIMRLETAWLRTLEIFE